MATQSKSVEQLKSEVLQTSSRPYELTEYNSDKIITGEINPGLINSNIATYEKNSEGTIIIDKNKDLSNQKMLISLNTTKISNTKFNQIIDTEFQDFILKADTSLLFLESKLAALQALDQQNRTSKKVNTDKIKQLQEQIVLLENQIIELRKLGNNLPDSISYGTMLQSSIPGLGGILLSKGRKAKARFDANGSFKVTLGNYDKNAQLIDGKETVSYTPVYAGNIATKNLTDNEARQYLINNTDLEPYFYSYTAQSQAKFAEVTSNTYNNLSTLVLDITKLYPTQASPESLANTNAFLDEQVQDANEPTAEITEEGKVIYTVSKNTRRAILKAATDNIIEGQYTDYDTGKEMNVAMDAGNPMDLSYDGRDVAALKMMKQIVARQRTSWLGQKYGNNYESNRLITYFRQFYNSMYYGINSRLILTPQAPFAARIIALRRVLINKIRNFENIGPAYSIEVNSAGATYSLNIDQLILPADRALLDTQIISGWSATKNLIEAAKKHWIYVVTQKPDELSFRFYLSDAQAQSYLNNYSDLRAAFGNDLVRAKRHWNYNGINEGRTFSSGNTILQIWRSSVDKKGYIEIVKTQPWHVRWSSEYMDLSKSSRVFLDDNGILYLYDKAKIVWQSYNEDE